MQTTFNDAIVFVVGGGNYIEYQNLTDYVKAKNVALGGEQFIVVLIHYTIQSF